MKFNLSLTAAWLIITLAVCLTSCSSNNTGIPYPDPAPDTIARVFLPGIVSKDGLTPDGKYFFYSSENEVKWISSSVLK